MCNSVHFGGQWHKTPSELATLVGGVDKLVWQKTNPFVGWPEGEDWRRMDLCLCPINLEATLAKAGFTWSRGTDPMEWFLIEKDDTLC